MFLNWELYYKKKSRNLLKWKRLITVEKNYIKEFLDKV